MRAAGRRQGGSAGADGASDPRVAGLELLLEIGCEEIPAGLIAGASKQLGEILAKHLNAARLFVGEAIGEQGAGGSGAGGGQGIETFGAPRRLTAIVRGLREKQEDIVEQVTGPPKSIGYDAVGAPTRAALSFAEKQGIRVGSIAIVRTAKGEYLSAKKSTRGLPAKELLIGILPKAISEINFPRSMYWTHPNELRFIRPVRWVLATFDGAPVKFAVGDVEAGAYTSGHRFLGRDRIRVSTAKDYEKDLKRNFVMVRPEERRDKISAELRRSADNGGFRARADAELLEAVTYLNEYPSVLAGNFDEEYLKLPAEILVTVMRDHQKYFAAEDEAGNLRPHFLAVLNLDKDRQGLIQAGHERVLKARFEDAKFFWEADQKKPLGEYREKLRSVTFESRLGSYYAKVKRVQRVASWLADRWDRADEGDGTGNDSRSGRGAAGADAERAAELAKCDLVTEMVHEFPELQGIVGGLYAREQGESEEVARAVYDQYRPLGIEDEIPRNSIGCVLAVADKLDSLVGCFAVGAIPTGSSDPFALRRAALGVVRIVLERRLALSLSEVVAVAAERYAHSEPKITVSEKARQEVLDFLLERARYMFREVQEFANDEISAVFAAGADDLTDCKSRLEALRTVRATENFASLAAAFKRVRNILEKSAGVARGAKWQAPRGAGAVPQADLFREDAERKLYHSAQMIGLAAGEHRNAKRYKEALDEIAQLRPAVDMFFDKVLVMAPDAEIRRNRLTLLAHLLEEFSRIADLSEIGPEEAGGKR